MSKPRMGDLVTHAGRATVFREHFIDDGVRLVSEVTGQGTTQRIVISRAQNSVSWEGPEGPRSRVLGGTEIAVENGCWQPYAFFAERLGEGSHDLQLFVPSLDRSVPAHLDITRAPNGERVVEGRLGSTAARIVIGRDGIVASAEVPSQKVRVTPPGEPESEPTPAGIRAEERTIAADQATLRGTLWVPDQGSDTLAIIVAGSGPTDRDGNNPLGISWGPLRALAQGLAARGMASLRYDKRGIGASEMRTPESAVTFATMVDDAEAILRAGKSSGPFKKIVVMGHSEGALIALALAQRNAMDGVALLSVPGKNPLETLRDQLARKVPAAELAWFDQFWKALREGTEPPPAPNALFERMFSPSVRPFLRSLVDIDPPSLLRAMPKALSVVVIQGSRDAQVEAKDARKLADGRPGTRFVLIPEAGHLLSRIGTDGKEPRIADEVFDALTSSF
jgi:alpha-beta hydrolase superfamily lysophospholipase